MVIGLNDVKESGETEKKEKKVKKGPGARSRLKLFVRNLPSTADDDMLEEVFGEYGPLRSCFVITEPGNKICTGSGFVQFALENDAAKALESLQGSKKLSNKGLLVDWSAKKKSGRADQEAARSLPSANEEPLPVRRRTARNMYVSPSCLTGSLPLSPETFPSLFLSF